MEDRQYYSRRLTSDELDVWLDIGQSDKTYDSTELARKYMDLEESLFFASFLGDDIAGVSTIFRDKTRMSMLLAGIRIQEELKPRLAKHIVKTSLPFFKTVALREVDALVNLTQEFDLPFPITPELDAWVQDALLENGFNEIGSYLRLKFNLHDKQASGTKLDSEPCNYEALKELFWRIKPKKRPDHAPLWLGLHISDISTISSNDGTILALGSHKIDESFVITALMYDDQRIDYVEVLGTITKHAIDQDCKYVVFNMIRENSQSMSILKEVYGTPIKNIELRLFRKVL